MRLHEAFIKACRRRDACTPKALREEELRVQCGHPDRGQKPSEKRNLQKRAASLFKSYSKVISGGELTKVKIIGARANRVTHWGGKERGVL